MDSHDFLLSTAEHPEYFLALAFSAPNVQQQEVASSITVDFTANEVVARLRRPQREKQQRQLLPTKETIAVAILLQEVVMTRGPDFMNTLEERAREFAKDAVLDYERDISYFNDTWFYNYQRRTTARFFDGLDITPEVYDAAIRNMSAAAEFLHRQRLAVDPPFTPDLMVLAGLVPMHFSVRTPEGERLFREIKIDAALWSFSLSKGIRNDRSFTDVEFRFRGIEAVRNAITAIADQWVASQDHTGLGHRTSHSASPAEAADLSQDEPARPPHQRPPPAGPEKPSPGVG